jgi:tRNA A37 methylthiotransferase MiaB
MLGDLARAGFTITEDHEDADVIIVNTCAFVEDAKSESLEAIVEAASLNEDGKQRKVVVTGCLAQRYGQSLSADLPEADLVVGFQNYGQLGAAVAHQLGVDLPEGYTGSASSSHEEAAAEGGEGASSSSSSVLTTGPVPSTSSSSRVQVGDATVPFRPEWDRVRLTPRHTAYLRVAEGCNHACTFCAIPGFRGKFRSKPFGQVVEEAKRLVAEGVVELNLIAEDSNQYGQDRCGGHGQLHASGSCWTSRRFIGWCSRWTHVALASNCSSSGVHQHLSDTMHYPDSFPPPPPSQTHPHAPSCRRDGKGLAQLLRELGAIPGLAWIRILYAYPSYFTPDLVAEIATNPKVGGAPPWSVCVCGGEGVWGRRASSRPAVATGAEWDLTECSLLCSLRLLIRWMLLRGPPLYQSIQL